MPSKHPPSKLGSVLSAFVLLAIFGSAIAALADWLLVLFGLGLELSGITKNALLYYFACVVMSIGLLTMSKAVRRVGVFLAFYPFGIIMIFLIGFESLIADPAPAGNDLAMAGNQLSMFNGALVQGFIWLTPAVVTGYYFLKAYREALAKGSVSKPS